MEAEMEKMQIEDKSVSPWGAKFKTCLPDDIVSQEIFSKLPVKSLLRFSSVNKKWSSFISNSNPNFIRSHLKHLKHVSSSPHYHKKVMFLAPNSPKLHFIDNELQLEPEKFDIPYYPFGNCLLGSCNGLLCIGIRWETKIVSAIICNPLLSNMYKEVPLSLPRPYLVGFGYDSAGDYKLVSIGFDNDYSVYQHIVNVFTVKTNSSRNIPVEPHVLRSLPRRNTHPFNYRFVDKLLDHIATFFNASLYWILDCILFQFDLTYEKFRLIELPTLDMEETSFNVMENKLTVDQKGCLCILAKDFNNGCLKTWIMKEDEYNNSISWSKGSKIQVPIFYMVYEPISLTASGEILMHVVKSISSSGPGPYQLILYNPHEGIVKTVSLPFPCPGVGRSYGEVNYLQTLVQPS